MSMQEIQRALAGAIDYFREHPEAACSTDSAALAARQQQACKSCAEPLSISHHSFSKGVQLILTPVQLSRHARNCVIFALTLIFLAAAPSARASAPDDLQFHIRITYALGNFTSVNGSWISTGAVTSGGDSLQVAHHAGWPPDGGLFQTAHFLTTLSDADGSITLRDQSTQIEWTGPDSTGSGSWVIQETTGIYSRLHGQGESTFAATFYPSCPDPSAPAACIMIEAQLVGVAHFE